MTIIKSELKQAMNRQAIELGAYVAGIRNQQEISQTDFAETIGVSRTTLRKLESGKASVGLNAYLVALIALGVENDVLHLDTALQSPLPAIKPKKKISFAKQLVRQGMHPRMAKNTAWLLAFSPEKRIHILSRAVRKWQRSSLEKMQNLLQAIEKQHGRAMLIGDAAMFLYGKPNRDLDYECWVRIADDELVEIITAFGFEIDRNRNGVLVAYDENRKLIFLLSKRLYTQDQSLIEYDSVEAQAKAVSFGDHKFLIPNIKDMLNLKKRGDEPNDLEDIAYLTALLAVKETLNKS